MILLSGADLVLPDRVIGGDLVIEDDRITDLLSTSRPAGFDGLQLDLSNHYIVPGFIDVHVHGVHGLDTLEGSSAIGEIAGHLPRYGVTAFCPTSIACSPDVLRRMLAAVRVARTTRVPGGARVLPAHLESSFINPDFRGAQPLDCLRLPPKAPRAALDAEAGFVERSRCPRRDRRRAPGRRHRHHRSGAAGRTRIDSRSHRTRSPRIARALGRQLRGGARRGSRRRAPCDAPFQQNEADDASCAGADRRRPRVGRDHRRAGVRLRARPPGGDAGRARGEASRACDGDHRRNGWLWVAGRRPDTHRRAPDYNSAMPRTSTMARSRAAS